MPWTRAVLLIVLIAAVAIPASASASRPMVHKINETRSAYGLPPLRYSPSLSRTSRRFARHLIKVDYFGHASRIQASRRFRRLGECLSLLPGWQLGRSRVVRGWLHSPVHRAILLSRSFTSVGASPARGRFGGRPATIWVAQFGR